MSSISIVWFRRDLRLADQAALTAAAERGPVLPVYILDDETPKHRKMGAASRWWLHHSLADLDQRLRQMGSRLILRSGNSAQILSDLVAQTGATEIHALHHYEPWWLNAERDVRAKLEHPVSLHLHHGNYLVPPGTITTGSGNPYKIYTPFWKALRENMPPALPMLAPDTIDAPPDWPDTDRLDEWALLPKNPNWAEAFGDYWQPGEAGAHANVDRFISKAEDYDTDRNLPSIKGSSRLSPHLHFGEISPAQVWHAVSCSGRNVTTYQKELVWRDYAQNVIRQFPTYGSESYRQQFEAFPWRGLSSDDVKADFDLWCRGQTGYPIVDAGMRELWATGWMHNRVRMIAASFLIKHLLIDWRAGEQWFWDTLVDADYASNATNWQWVSGTGVDSNMFVRIMAPLSQSEKFDAGDYIRKWVPELAGLDDPYIHDPEEHGCKPDSYPAKIIGHREARHRALDAYATVKN
ncbi:deoxyribodipyrimidine photo-lyase [Parasphingopyxis sp. CP4]|uniref:cryptochrome/photolyase family protein n=1 Tax=Parasphingopyxis sp. CP4 TaxID=2724527 RepID=UPI0015A13F2A|nr:deoxyribodipyrimidine photo-lyase [Parasphingopyxis sp. CP4]QLC21358.1 deoxyribodipyrimidine photo-lyase [Parasphingopyxis sp. CP4]